VLNSKSICHVSIRVGSIFNSFSIVVIPFLAACIARAETGDNFVEAQTRSDRDAHTFSRLKESGVGD
jgi:hypothetical protein